MSGDLRIVPASDGSFDLSIVAGDFERDDGLGTSVLISLFTDATARDGDTLPGNDGYRGGWWNDALQGTPLGSRLWLLRRAKLTNDTLQKAKEYAEEALKWMVDAGIASRVTATATRTTDRTDGLDLHVEVVRGAGATRSNVPAAAPLSSRAVAGPSVFSYSINWTSGRVSQG
ncbi:phage GP46 family protein [bacterium]|nr:phage GP46 family protein [bacterium]